MDRFIKYLVVIPVIILALCPALPFDVPMFGNSLLWVWMVLISGFLAVAYFFTQAQLILRLIVAYCFINCFFSSAPYLSFTSFFSIISMAYFYLLCLKVKDWNFISKVILCILTLNVFFLIMQIFGRDSLLNFSYGDKVRCFGTVGNGMQLRSMVIVCLAFLINYVQPKPLKKYFWGVIALLFISGIIYILGHHVLSTFPRIRLVVWGKTFELIKQHPIIGWGGATFRVIFQALGNGTNEKVGQGVFGSPHNEFLQIAFEYGVIGFSLMVGFLGTLIYKARKNKITLLSIGLLLTTMMFHFPFRQIQIPLIIVLFLANLNKEEACIK